MNKIFLILILLIFSNCQRKSSSVYFLIPCNSQSELLESFEKTNLKIIKSENGIMEIQYPNNPNESAVIAVGEFDNFYKNCNVYYLSTKYKGLSFDEVNIEDMSDNERENTKEIFFTEILSEL